MRSLPDNSLEQSQIIAAVPIAPISLAKRVTGGFALIDSLKRHGVKHIFGYPGGAILP